MDATQILRAIDNLSPNDQTLVYQTLARRAIEPADDHPRKETP